MWPSSGTVMNMRNEENQQGKVPLKGILKKGEKPTNQRVQDFWVDGVQLPSFEVQGRAPAPIQKDAKDDEIKKLKQYIKKLKLESVSQQNAHEKQMQDLKVQAAEEGRKQGIEQGEKKAQAKFENDLNVLKSNLANVFQTLSQEKNQYFQELQEGSLHLSMILLQRILNDAIDHYQDLVVKMVEKGMQYLGRDDKVVLRVHPDEVGHVQSQEAFWNPITAGAGNIEVKGDDRIQRGGCYIESSSGTIDMRIDRMAKDILETLLQTHEDLTGKKLDPSVGMGHYDIEDKAAERENGEINAHIEHHHNMNDEDIDANGVEKRDELDEDAGASFEPGDLEP